MNHIITVSFTGWDVVIVAVIWLVMTFLAAFIKALFKGKGQ